MEIRAPSREDRGAAFFLGNCTLFIKVAYSSILLKSKGFVGRAAIQLQNKCQELVLYEYWLLLDVEHNVPNEGRARLWIAHYIEIESNQKKNQKTPQSSNQRKVQWHSHSSHKPPHFLTFRMWNHSHSGANGPPNKPFLNTELQTEQSLW